VVGIRHWTFACAITLGASTVAAAATAIIPLAFTMNLRRPVGISSSSRRHKLPHE